MTWHTLSDQQPNDGERVLLLRDGKWMEAEYCTVSLRAGPVWDVSRLPLFRVRPGDLWARVTTPAPAEPDGLRLVTTEETR